MGNHQELAISGGKKPKDQRLDTEDVKDHAQESGDGR